MGDAVSPARAKGVCEGLGALTTPLELLMVDDRCVMGLVP